MCRRHRGQALLPQWFFRANRFGVHFKSLVEAGLLPQWFFRATQFGVHRKSLVGASLLAIAADQLASVLNVLPPSRASLAPTVVFQG
jgi:hypothetical protein